MDTSERTAGRRRDPRTDAAVVDAVLDLVSAGATLSGLSLVTIADQAGVSRNSLYRRWKTKEELYLDALDAINKPLPELDGSSAREDLVALLAVLAERTLDRRASSVPRALVAEAAAFPELHRRYFDEIVAPRQEVAYQILRRGIASGEIRPDIDIRLAHEILVAPILARMSSGSTEGFDAEKISRQIVDLLYDGIRPPR